MMNKIYIHNSLNNNILPPPHKECLKVISHSESAAYTILPPKACALRGGIFCALLLGLTLGFSSCRKATKVAEPGRSIEGPTPKNAPAPNQGVSFTIDTTWLPDTIIDFTPNP